MTEGSPAKAVGLFSVGDRTRTTPRRHGEGGYTFLDQAASPYWGRVRDQLENWYAGWRADRDDLRARFTTPDVAQHYGAFWELYLDAALRRAGFSVEREPVLPGLGHRPDFLVRKAGCPEMVFEAAIAYPGSVAERNRQLHEGSVYDELDKTNPTHWLTIEVLKSAPSSPPVRKIRGRLEIHLSNNLKRKTEWEWAENGWAIRVEAYPRTSPRDPRRRNAVRPVAAYESDGTLDERPAPVGKVLEEKRSGYAPQGIPYVICVLPEISAGASFGDRLQTPIEVGDPVKRFFGQSNTRHVSAVLTASFLKPRTIGQRFPIAWFNPNADNPIPADALPWPHAAGGSVTNDEEMVLATDFFDLPREWPGPDPPFPLD